MGAKQALIKKREQLQHEYNQAKQDLEDDHGAAHLRNSAR